jgi:hypothetical protein
MPCPVQTLYAIDPASRGVRAVIQVEADGWLDAEVEPMLAAMVRATEPTQLALALAVSLDSSFMLRRRAGHGSCEIDELETSELLSPHPLHPDPSRLMDCVLRWCTQAGLASPSFMAMARMPKRAPEIVALLSGAELAIRDAAAEPLASLER